jgi:manganese efflux pump family protein
MSAQAPGTRPGVRDEFQSVRDEIQMSVAALFTLIATILAGLLLLVIWLIEYDREFQRIAATRLPVPVISAHALLGITGLILWVGYLLADKERLAWATVADLGIVALLGLIMAARWIRVYRAFADSDPSPTRVITVPPERHFPLLAVIAHGILAVTTVGLVLFTVFFAGRS